MHEGVGDEDGAAGGPDGAVEAGDIVGEAGVEKGSGVEGAPGPRRADARLVGDGPVGRVVPEKMKKAEVAVMLSLGIGG